MNKKIFAKTSAALVVLFALIAGPALAQDDSDIPGATGTLPTTATYPDMGEEFRMQWMGWADGEDAGVDFGVPETDNRLWSIRCERPSGGVVRIVHQIEGGSKEMGAGDRFGFTIRVDERPSLGFIARMELSDGEGGKYYAPKFYTSNRHPVYEDLAKGKRAYINLDGNKFSVHLRGSGDALTSFLRACQ